MATITIKNLERCMGKLKSLSNIDVTDTINKATIFVHGQAKLLAPFDTGNLAGSIHLKVETGANKVQGRVYTNLQYAPFVEFGTGIAGNGTYPNKEVALSYRSTPWVYTPDDGKTYYRTEGQVASPYLYPALKSSEKYIKLLISKGLNKNIEDVCK